MGDLGLCELCDSAKAFVYCKSDTARLCLDCDNHVHSANQLALRHRRFVLCEKCKYGSAIFRCMDEKTSKCQDCDCLRPDHNRLPLPSYTGCPPVVELIKLFYCLSENNNNTNNNNNGSSLFGIEWSMDANVDSSSLLRGEDGSNEAQVKNNNNGVINGDDAIFFGLSQNSSTKYEDNNNNYKFGIIENDGGLIDLSFMEKNPSAATDQSIENAIEVSPMQPIPFQPSQVDSSSTAIVDTSNCLLVNIDPNQTETTNVNLGLATRRLHQSNISLSLSNIKVESGATTDYQDCGMSRVFFPCSETWDRGHQAGHLLTPENLDRAPQARLDAKMRYQEKKKNRTFRKQIRYESRKARADGRRRVKGRFVKTGDDDDYEPRGTNEP